jgi:hypothetical protein
MWVVGAYDTLKLKAWVETNQKGRSFIFASPGNEVARHMHGDLSNKGIIAAAVFTEGYVAPPPPVFYDRFLGGYSGGITIGGGGNYSANATPGIYGEVKTKGAVPPPAAAPAPARSFERRETKCDYLSLDRERAVELSEEVAGPGVGAGREIIQKIGTAQGLVRPVLDRIITLKYMWYDDLVKKLESRGFVREGAQPNGFPGDREKRFMDLSHVPVAGAPAPAPVVHRFA